MASGENLGLGLVVRRTSSFGRKRILILNHHMGFDSTHPHLIGTTPTPTPKKSNFSGNEYSNFCGLLEALPQEILIKIFCGVDHDDLKRLFHVSTTMRDAAIIAKEWHFEFSTPKKIPAFRCSLNLEDFPSSDFAEIEAPNAPKQSRLPRSRLTRKNSAAICISLFASSPSH